jgi:hypothetical protein
MTDRGRPITPAPRPCVSCPYRRDTPSGVWEAHEYEKLPAYDEEQMMAQPFGAFFCHQQDGRLCAGWVGVHDMSNNIGVRLLFSARNDGTRTEQELRDEIRAVLDYETDVPLYESGHEAALAGLRDVANPSEAAERMIEQLERKQERRKS